MNPFFTVLLVICVILLVALVVLYILGKKTQKKREEQQAQMAATAQTVSMLIIDKKRMRLKDAGLPAAVVEQSPKLLRRSKVPIVKVKVGPKVVSMICDAEIFDLIPVKKEVKAVVSGLYITNVKGIRGGLNIPVKKKGFRAKLREKAAALQAETDNAKDTKKSKKK